MLELEQAQEQVFAAIEPLPAEPVLLSDALDRILREDIIAPLDLPVFTNSAMDGYAVRSKDLQQASSRKPVKLKLQGKIPAGALATELLQPGACARIFTGSPLPPQADAVMMQEDTLIDPLNPELILFQAEIPPGENVRRQGEDIQKGELVLKAGTRLSPGAVSLLGSLGFAHVQAGQQPRVGLLATGNELREPSSAGLAGGELFESNRAALAALCKRAGALAKIYPIVGDTLPATEQALQIAFLETDLVVTSGGVSVGEFDLVKAGFEALGGAMQFWKISLKPGKPFAFGQREGKLFFGLPGNPVSSFVTFMLLVYPALIRLQGGLDWKTDYQTAVLTEPLINTGGRRHFFRIIVDADGRAHSAGLQASHALRSLAAANGLADVPPKTTLPAGSTVRIIRI